MNALIYFFWSARVASDIQNAISPTIVNLRCLKKNQRNFTFSILNFGVLSGWWTSELFSGWFSTLATSQGFPYSLLIFYKCTLENIKNYTVRIGFEPCTPRLRVSCSTDWASRADRDFYWFFTLFSLTIISLNSKLCWCSLCPIMIC